MGPPPLEGGYYSPQYNNDQQYGQQQQAPPPPGYPQPSGQPQCYSAQQQKQQPPHGTYSSAYQQMQYQQPPQGSHHLYSPSGGNYPHHNSNQNGYGQKYPPASMSNVSQQPCPAGFNKPTPQYDGMPPSHSQHPPLYPGQSHNGADSGESDTSSVLNGTGELVHKGTLPGSRVLNSSQLCSSGLPVIEGDNCRAPIKLSIGEKVMQVSGDSFYVTDSRKKNLYNVDGSRAHDQRKILKTANGKFLLQMRHLSTVAKKIVISNMVGEAIAMLQKQRVQSNTHKRIDGTLHCGNRNSKLTVIGNAQATSFHVDNGREVMISEISRASRSMKKIFSGQDSYTADVSAGSPAFMVMVVVAIDEIYCDG